MKPLYNNFKKPRQTRGTPAHIYRNYVAGSIIGIGLLFGVIYSQLPFITTLREKAKKDFFERTVEQEERKYYMGFVQRKNRDQIEKIIAEKDYFEK